MPFCSQVTIQVTEEDQSYKTLDLTDKTNNHQFDETILCAIGDQLEEEPTFTPQVESQDSKPIDAQYSIVRGRRNKMQTISWTRTLTHATPKAAREYLHNHVRLVPSWTIGARILLMGSPLKLDLGFPITTPDNIDEEGSQFNFSFGTRF